MKIAIYTPYLDSAGGGEKYMLTIAKSLTEGNIIHLLLDKNLSQIGEEKLRQRINSLHNIDLSNIEFVVAPVGVGSKFWDRFWFLRKYDWLFYNTDGSVFFSTARNNILHFQIPFQHPAPAGIWGSIKLGTWKKAIFNSQFTKDFIVKNWPIKGPVVYPPVDIDLYKPLKKEKIILNVGRFVSFNQIKKQHIMVEAFKKLVDQHKLKGWSLHLAGGARDGDLPYIEDLKKMSQGYDIVIHPNMQFDQLVKLTGQATIYWHAMGYQETEPAKFEHFGISTVEAMSAGCVPVVINKGGQPEIVTDGENGLLWDTEEELISKTGQLILNSNLVDKLSSAAIKRSQDFSTQKFIKQIQELINE